MRGTANTKTRPADPASIEADIFRDSHWIWPEDHHWDIVNSYALFRKSFRLTALPDKAPFFITADQSYRLFVNGRFVGRGPARGFQTHWPYDEIDLRPFLRIGQNLVAIRAHNPGRSNFQYLCQGFAGLLVAAAWGDIRLTSDLTWKSLRQGSASRDTAPSSMQLFSQEHVDLRMTEGDWTAASYDDTTWAAPVARAWNAPPWSGLQPRAIPLLSERKVPLGRCIGVGEGKCAVGYRQVRDVVALRYREDRIHQPSASRTMPGLIEPIPKGSFRSYLIDFGKTMVGNLSVKIAGATGGEIIDTHYCETIDDTTLTPDLVIPTHCRNAFGDRLICGRGDFSHDFYHHYGFRFLTVTVRDAPASFRLGLHLNWIGYPLVVTGDFTNSDRELEQIWQTSAWTQQCCSLDSYVDTPWREQAQWWGDARVQGKNTFYLSGDIRLFRRGIGQIADQVTADGVTYGHAPTMAHECVLPDFTLIWLLTLWDYYWQTGSTEPLRAHGSVVKGALKYFQDWTDRKTGLVAFDPRYWLFLDWTDLYREGTPTVYNLWLLITLEKLALLHRKAGEDRESRGLQAWAEKLRKSLGRLVGSDGLVRDGIDPEGKIVPGTSIHSQTLAMMANLAGINRPKILDTILLPYIRGESTPKAMPSAYWVTYLFSQLSPLGYNEEIIRFIKKHWMPMVKHGTTWENFSPRRGDESFSHAWSAHPIYHLIEMLGGITQTAPAWSEISFQPYFHGTRARIVVPTPHGPITSEWQRENKRVRIELELPASTKASIKLPGVTASTISKSRGWLVSI